MLHTRSEGLRKPKMKIYSKHSRAYTQERSALHSHLIEKFLSFHFKSKANASFVNMSFCLTSGSDEGLLFQQLLYDVQ